MGALIKSDGPGGPAGTDPHQHLTFTLGGEMFAIGILCVKEIIEYGQLTAVPMMPDCIRGVINLRGSVVPVIDLACRFWGRLTTVTRRTCIVIIEANIDDQRQDVGIIVDSVSEVLDIPQNRIEPPPSFGARIRTEFVRGMGVVNNCFVIIFDVDRALALEDITTSAAWAVTQPDAATSPLAAVSAAS